MRLAYIPFLSEIKRLGLALRGSDISSDFRDFYKVVKMSEEKLRFTFITGITKFAQVSVFSALNNLTDITLDPEYSTPWKGKRKTLFKIGVSFDHKKRKIKEWRVKKCVS